MNLSDYAPQLAVALIALSSAIVTTVINLWWEEYRRKRRDEREDTLFERQAQEWISQQWWQRKADTYSEIVEALWQLMEYAREYLDHIYAHSGQTVDEEHEKYAGFDRNKARLIRAADVGTFVISNAAADALQRYVRTVRSIPEYVDLDEEVEKHFSAANQCLQEVKAAALEDLRVGGRKKIRENNSGGH